MLVHRLGRWPNIKPTLVQYLVFAGTRPCVVVSRIWCGCVGYLRGQTHLIGSLVDMFVGLQPLQ